MKMLLVIDKPIDCQSCLCNDYEEGYCKAFGDGRTNVCDWNSSAIPRWCPLKPMPKNDDYRADTRLVQMEIYSTGYADGWNDCLKEITDERNINN